VNGGLYVVIGDVLHSKDIILTQYFSFSFLYTPNKHQLFALFHTLCIHHTQVETKRVWAVLHDRLDITMVLVESGRTTSYYQDVHDIAVLVVDP